MFQNKKVKVFGARRATAELGKQASMVQLWGRVTEQVGAGSAAKWRVRRGKAAIDTLLKVQPLKLYMHF